MNEKRLLIANGVSEKSNNVKNVMLSWQDMLKRLSTAKVSPSGRSYILTGQCPSGVRGSKSGDLIERSYLLMIDLDCDDNVMSWDDFVFYLELSLPFHWAAYTTRSYRGNDVHYRIIVPFESSLVASKHRAAVQKIVDLLPDDVALVALDQCSYNINQPIFLPCVSDEEKPFHCASGGDCFFNPSAMDLPDDETQFSADDDLEVELLAQPIDLTESQIQQYLDAVDPNTLEYGLEQGGFGWGNVGAALAHQFQKSDRGFELWVAWSARNAAKHNDKDMRAKYDSFDVLPRGKRPITFASVMGFVKDNGGITATPGEGKKSLFDELIEEAAELESIEQYNDFKQKIKGIDALLLPDDARQMIAHEIAQGIGKQVGLTKRDVSKAIGAKKITTVENKSLPKWAKGWCYIEKSCEFYHIPTNHAINKEAFNARYDRMNECLVADSNAARLVLVDYAIPTFADRMYWPGAGMSFEHEGKMMINSYRDEGVAPVDSICEEGQRAVDLMLGHLEMLVPIEEEREIILDWFTHVYRNKGQRINWALVMQGAQGTGKSYFGVMMRMLLGSGAQMLDPSAISERFTGWAHGSVLTVVEEMRVSGTSKYNIVDRMKPFITNDVVQIEEKGRDHRDVPNFTSYFMLTNHKDAIPLTKGDRRYCVIYTSIQTEKELFDRLGGDKGVGEYFDDLFGSTMEHAGAIARFFLDRPISESFKAKGRAPDTQSRRTMMALSSSPEKLAVEDAIEMHHCPIINDDILDITHLQSLVSLDDNDDFPTRRTLSSVLLELGYEPVENRIWSKSTRKKHRLWKKTHIDDETLIEKFDSFHNRGDDKSRYEFNSDCPF